MIGVDVSHWDGIIDWGSVTADFAIMKCTQGVTYFDDQYLANKAGCVANQIPHGVYHYFEPDIDGTLQAEYFYSKANDKELKVWVIDVEKAGTGLVYNLEKMIRRLWDLTGWNPVIYTRAGFWNVYVPVMPDWAKPCPLWVANYTTAATPLIPNGWTSWLIWQYTESGTMVGITGAVDLNRFNVAADDMFQFFGNGSAVFPSLDRVRVSYAGGLNIRSAPIVATNIIGGAYYGSIWTAMNRVKDSLGREWVQVGPSAFIAGWFTTNV
jgi:GH25 family lysozyme M1 (1,4-beta-N-acetylmuramidase)